jgi:hypothetical protein
MVRIARFSWDVGQSVPELGRNAEPDPGFTRPLKEELSKAEGKAKASARSRKKRRQAEDNEPRRRAA